MKQLGVDVPKAAVGKKVEDGKGKQADASDQIETDQPAAETDDAFQILTKDATPQHAEGKPQTGTGDGEKHHVSQGRGDFITPSHRSDTGAPTPPGAEVSATAKTLNDVPTQPPIPSSAPHASENAAAPATLVSQPGPQPAAVPLSGVAIEIAGKALAGKNRFEIRLDPPELGRIDVRLDVDRDGNVTSRLTVDRPETLDLLRRDAAGLERVLQDAGLKTANNGLQFSLRDQSMNEQQAGTSHDAAVLVATDESMPSNDVIPQRYRLAGQGGGLDIRV
jgi:chemotaxis protein MotD